jgi:hypothetical protein
MFRFTTGHYEGDVEDSTGQKFNPDDDLYWSKNFENLLKDI